MANVQGIVRRSKADVRGIHFIQVQDSDTNQFITVYAKRGEESADVQAAVAEAAVDTDVLVSGTLHPIGDNVKIIATAVSAV
jgi:aspartyl/asparaginyl-tRNA synthetase